MIIWNAKDPATRTEIEERMSSGKKVMPSTILTLLSRLEGRGVIAREKRGKINYYRSAIELPGCTEGKKEKPEIQGKCIRGIYPVEEEEIRQSYEKACIRAGIEGVSRKTIYKNTKIATPFVPGFYKPILLLPEWVRKEDALDLLFFHECVHIRHKDTWYKLL